MSLTELAIKNLKPKEKSYRIADSGGLCIEITHAGGKLWCWQYYFHGKPQILFLGKYPAVSLSETRKLLDEAWEQVKAGKHPTREKKAQKLRSMHGENWQAWHHRDCQAHEAAYQLGIQIRRPAWHLSA